MVESDRFLVLGVVTLASLTVAIAVLGLLAMWGPLKTRPRYALRCGA